MHQFFLNREHRKKHPAYAVEVLGPAATISRVERLCRSEGLGVRTAAVVKALRGKRVTHYDVANRRRQVVRECGPVGTSELCAALRKAGLKCHKATARRLRREIFGSTGINP